MRIGRLTIRLQHHRMSGWGVTHFWSWGRIGRLRSVWCIERGRFLMWWAKKGE